MNILLEAIRSMDSWEAGWWGGGVLSMMAYSGRVRYALIDCASIFVGVIRHHEDNFHLFS